MLLITTIDMVTTLTEADCKMLAGYTAKDKIIVLSKEGAMMPVALFQTLSSLKCTLEIKELDTKDLFKLGYTIGSLVASAKPTEKIIILSNKEFADNNKNVTWTDKLTGVKGAKTKSTAKKADSAPQSKSAEAVKTVAAKASAKSKAAEENTVEKPVAKTAAKTTKKATSTLWPILGKYSKMKPYKEFVEKNEDALKGAILSATDDEITFKFQMQINFGAEGIAVWEILQKHFADIQAQIKAMK